jgi:hypothetical protein
MSLLFVQFHLFALKLITGRGLLGVNEQCLLLEGTQNFTSYKSSRLKSGDVGGHSTVLDATPKTVWL